MTPNPEWLPFFKLAVFAMIIVFMFTLAMVIALGRVEQSTSFGLRDVISALGVVLGAAGVWAFQDKEKR